MKKLVVAVVLTGCIAAFADGRTLTWQGATGGTWSVAENWLDGDETATSAPADGDTLRFVNTSALATVNDLDGLTVGGLALENTKALSITGNAFAFTGEITMNKLTANVVDTFQPDIELKSDLVVRFSYGSGNKSHQIKFTGVLSGAGGLAVDTTNGIERGPQRIYFSVLTSSVHMAWMRAICGRLKSDYSYSKDIVYNNFPLPFASSLCPPCGEKTNDESATAAIEKTAQGILDARALYPDSSLADLYDPLAMPPELRKAHAANDAAVLKAYGWPTDLSEPEIVSRLFDMYAKLTKMV